MELGKGKGKDLDISVMLFFFFLDWSSVFALFFKIVASFTFLGLKNSFKLNKKGEKNHYLVKTAHNSCPHTMFIARHEVLEPGATAAQGMVGNA